MLQRHTLGDKSTQWRILAYCLLFLCCALLSQTEERVSQYVVGRSLQKIGKQPRVSEKRDRGDSENQIRTTHMGNSLGYATSMQGPCQLKVI